MAPLSVRAALGGVDGPLKGLTGLRDDSIDAIYAIYKERGTPSQRTLLDAWSRSRDEVRSISDVLITELEQINSNNQDNQLRTAAVLAAMGISPVISVHVDFGGDNHADNQFVNETARHLTGIPALGSLMAQLDTLRTQTHLTTDVTVACLNVFGRTLKKKGMLGRDHNSGHHCMVLMGDRVNPGIVGGVELNGAGNEYIAQSIDSATGSGGGDIPFEETLGAGRQDAGQLARR